MKAVVLHEGAKSAPPVVVAGTAWLFGLTLNDWVAIGTLAYLVLQGGFLIWRWYRESKNKE
jgi:hypothetical protein